MFTHIIRAQVYQSFASMRNSRALHTSISNSSSDGCRSSPPGLLGSCAQQLRHRFSRRHTQGLPHSRAYLSCHVTKGLDFGPLQSLGIGGDGSAVGTRGDRISQQSLAIRSHSRDVRKGQQVGGLGVSDKVRPRVSSGLGGTRARSLAARAGRVTIAVFYPFSQFCRIDISPPRTLEP